MSALRAHVNEFCIRDNVTPAGSDGKCQLMRRLWPRCWVAAQCNINEGRFHACTLTHSMQSTWPKRKPQLLSYGCALSCSLQHEPGSSQSRSREKERPSTSHQLTSRLKTQDSRRCVSATWNLELGRSTVMGHLIPTTLILTLNLTCLVVT